MVETWRQDVYPSLFHKNWLRLVVRPSLFNRLECGEHRRQFFLHPLHDIGQKGPEKTCYWKQRQVGMPCLHHRRCDDRRQCHRRRRQCGRQGHSQQLRSGGQSRKNHQGTSTHVLTRIDLPTPVLIQSSRNSIYRQKIEV